jgi:hypothetical protein
LKFFQTEKRFGFYQKLSSAQMQRIQSLSALPPLAFRFGDDFVWNRSEWQQGAEVSVFR